MKQESRLLIAALGCAVAGRKIESSPQVDWNLFVSLARAHDVEALVCSGLKRESSVWESLPDGVQKHLTGAYMRAVYMDAQFDHLRQQLQTALVKAGVRHIFLKGAVLKQDYPIPALRTMCDLDVLVYAEDFVKIEEIALGMGAKALTGDGNHRNYAFRSGVTVEFHPNLLHHDTPVGTQINPGWQYAAEGNSCAGELTPEGFYLNTICHLANHFVAGGVGIRFVLDVWVNRHLRKPGFDRGFVDGELERVGLLEFAQNIESLADCWFGGEEETALLAELGEYILTSGSHGANDRAMLNAVALSPGGSRSSALLKKAFYSRAEMEDRFTWLKGRPWLMPAAWCVRAFRAVTKHGSLILAWGRGTGQFTKAEIAEQKDMLARFGIRKGT